MASNEISILVRARDDASKTFKQVDSNATKLQKSLTTGLKYGALGAAGALVGVAAAGLKFVGVAADLNESLSKVGVVFGENAGEIESWAQSAARNMGQSQQQALEAAGTFGNLFDAMGLGGKQATSMSKQIVELASDLASFNNISVDDALNALQSGLVGEVEPLRQFGVAINAAAVEQKAWELGLASASGELTEAAKAQARYALILEQTTNAQGDFERTSGGLANQQRILSAQWKDLQATLGQVLLPTVTKLTTAFTEFLGNHQQDIERLAAALGEKLPQAIDAVARAVEPHIPTLKKFADDVLRGWANIIDVLMPKLEDLGQWLSDHKTVLFLVALGAGAIVIAFGSWPLALGAAALAAGFLTTKIQELRKENEDLDTTLDALEKTIGPLGKAVDALVQFSLLQWNLILWNTAEVIRGFNEILLPSLRERINEVKAVVDGAKDVFWWFRDAIYGVRDALWAVGDAIRSLPSLPSWDIPSPRGFLDNLPGRAEGIMNAQRAHWAMVGERGPELMYVPKGASIYSARDTRNMLAGAEGEGGGGAGATTYGPYYIDQVVVQELGMLSGVLA